MHEVGVAREILKIALENARGKKIKNIKVALAEDGHTTPASLTDAFSLIAKGTSAEGALLTIQETQEIESRVVDLEVEK
jgi:Zn finger protein HypA/HybF involved in hydrogenase expression